MRRVRIESQSHELTAGFVVGVACVNDSAVNVVDLECGGRKPFVVLEDLDESGKAETLNLTRIGLEGKE